MDWQDHSVFRRMVADDHRGAPAGTTAAMDSASSSRGVPSISGFTPIRSARTPPVRHGRMDPWAGLLQTLRGIPRVQPDSSFPRSSRFLSAAANSARIGNFAVGLQHPAQLVVRLQPVGGAIPERGSYAYPAGPRIAEKITLSCIELMGGHPEIGQNAIHLLEPRADEALLDVPEVHPRM